jgi:hypothetical protein
MRSQFQVAPVFLGGEIVSFVLGMFRKVEVYIYLLTFSVILLAIVTYL